MILTGLNSRLGRLRRPALCLSRRCVECGDISLHKVGSHTHAGSGEEIALALPHQNQGLTLAFQCSMPASRLCGDTSQPLPHGVIRSFACLHYTLEVPNNLPTLAAFATWFLGAFQTTSLQH
ncbi:Uncharacterised protein [Vibrio cholerae]|nr:Uncharacterised protein [Vibrio cholerae]